MQKTENLEKEILEIKVLPKLRFREFNDSWNEMKLNDFTKIQRGKFTPRPRNNPIYYGGNIPFVQTSDVVKSKGKIFKYSQTLNEKGLKVSKKFKKGTILITVAANIGFSGVLEIDVACPDSLIGITCNEHNYNFFLQYLIEIEQPKMDYLAVAAAQKNINLEFLYPYKFILPTLKEQKKIASFLSVVDEKLQQITKKKELSEDYKKGIMQKIFSQEIRFKDDNGNNYSDWKEKKLSKVLYEHKLKSSGKEEVYSVSVHKGLINQVEHLGRSFSAKNTDNYNLVKPNDIVYTKSPTGEFPYGIIKQAKIKKDVIVSPLYAIFTPESKHLGYILDAYFESRQNTHNYLHSIIQKGAKNTINITNSTFVSKSLKLPNNFDEQKKIGEFLLAIDKKIKLVNNQLEKTKEFKKGLLQQMFV